MVFQSGNEIPTDPTTLYVDCSANGTDFFPAGRERPVWEGKRINLQPVVLPPIPTSGAVIAALELKLPQDEERKNAACTVYRVTQMPEEFLNMFLADWKTNQAMTKILGLGFQTSRRNFNLKHMGYIELLKFLYLGKFCILHVMYFFKTFHSRIM